MRAVAIVIGGLLAFGCGSEARPDGPPHAGAVASKSDQEQIAQWLSAAHAHDGERLGALASADFRGYLNAGTLYGELRGPEGASKVPQRDGSKTCETQLQIIGEQRALVVDICTKPEGQKFLPLRAFRVRELELDFWGRVRRVHTWRDLLTDAHQLGASVVPDSPGPEPPISDGASAVATGSMTEQTNREAALRYFAAVGARDVDTAAALVAPGLVDRDMTVREPRQFATAAEFADELRRWLSRRDPLEVRVRYAFAAGDWVALRWTHAYKLAKPLPGAQDSVGRRAYVYGLAMLRFEDGKIVRIYRIRDRGEELRQLQILPRRWFNAARVKAAKPVPKADDDPDAASD